MKIKILRFYEKNYLQCIVIFVFIILAIAIYCNNNLNGENNAFYINLFVATVFFVATFVFDLFKNVTMSKFDFRKEQYFNMKRLKEVYDVLLNAGKDVSYFDLLDIKSTFLEDEKNPEKPSLVSYNGFHFSGIRMKFEEKLQDDLNWLLERIENDLLLRLSSSLKKEMFFNFSYNVKSSRINKSHNFEKNIEFALKQNIEFDENIEKELGSALKSLKIRIIKFNILYNLLLYWNRSDYRRIIKTLNKIENIYSLKALLSSKFEDDTYYNLQRTYDELVEIQKNIRNVERQLDQYDEEKTVFKRELIGALERINKSIEDVDIKLDM